MYNEELMYEDKRGDFVEKEIERTERTWAHHLLASALIINVILIGKSEPIVIAIFVIGALLGICSGYKIAFDRIRRR